jgi:hypothetical protein
MVSVANTTTNLQTTTLQGTQSTQSTLTGMPSTTLAAVGSSVWRHWHPRRANWYFRY